jgi:hypothetical protein
MAGAGWREPSAVTFAFFGAAMLACYWVEGLLSVSLQCVGLGRPACTHHGDAVRGAVGSAADHVHVHVHAAGARPRDARPHVA